MALRKRRAEYLSPHHNTALVPNGPKRFESAPTALTTKNNNNKICSDKISSWNKHVQMEFNTSTPVRFSEGCKTRL